MRGGLPAAHPRLVSPLARERDFMPFGRYGGWRGTVPTIH